MMCNLWCNNSGLSGPIATYRVALPGEKTLVKPGAAEGFDTPGRTFNLRAGSSILPAPTRKQCL